MQPPQGAAHVLEAMPVCGGEWVDVEGLGDEVEGAARGGGFGRGARGEVVGSWEGVVVGVGAYETGGVDEGLVEGDVGYLFDLAVWEEGGGRRVVTG